MAKIWWYGGKRERDDAEGFTCELTHAYVPYTFYCNLLLVTAVLRALCRGVVEPEIFAVN